MEHSMEPGLPYGKAIRAGFFGQESEAAGRFVAWFRRLFALPVAPPKIHLDTPTPGW